MIKPFLILLVVASMAACSGSGSNKSGTPDKEEARTIVKNWLDHQNPGGHYFEPENFEIVSVSGDEKLTIINFKWTGLDHPPALPDSDLTPAKVKDKPQKMQVQKKNGEWEVLVVENE